MNIQAKPTRTPAEQGLLDAFGAMLTELPGDAAVTAKRDRLMADFSESGLPSRRIESWHYTDLRTLLRNVPAPLPAGSAAELEPILPGTLVLPLLQGDYVKPQEADGIVASEYRDELMAGRATDTLAVRSKDDLIGLINSAFVTNGYKITLAEGAEITAPVELQAVQNGGQVHGRFDVTVGKGAKATFIERHAAAGADAGLTSSASLVDLGEDAEITWVVLQERGGEDTHLGQFRARLAKGARLKLFVINAGGQLVRQEVDISVAGEEAHFDLRGINLLAGHSHTDLTLTLGHSVPHTTSEEIVRNVVLDRARGAFQGQIRVARPAQKTDAQMSCNTLLLSEDAEFDAKPELEIFADDVVCAHGATVDDLDADHLFYLQARGVSEKTARALLVNGFVDELLDELEDEALSDALKARVEDWLARHV